MSYHRICRIASTLFLGVVLAVCLLGLVVSGRVAVAGSANRIAGVAIGGMGNYTRIPRRSLDCTDRAPDGLHESCRTRVDGEELRVDLAYTTPPNVGVQRCVASYGARTSTCRGRSFTIGGAPYAITSAGIGVRDEALRDLRRKYRVANLSEGDWIALMKGAACLLAIAVTLVGVAWVRGQWPLKVLVGACGGAGAFVLGFFLLGMYLLGAGLIDSSVMRMPVLLPSEIHFTATA